MLMQAAAAPASPVPSILAGLAPIAVTLITSLLTFVLNKVTGLIAKWPNMAKNAFVVVTGALLAFVGQKFGLDVTTAQGFAGSLVAIAVFHFGKAGGAGA